MKFASAVVCVATVWVLSGCGGGDAGASAEPGVPITSTTQALDASGGTVTLQGLSLVVPATALSASTELGLQQETAASPALARFRFSPAGQALNTPAELRYSAPGLPANVRFFWDVDGEQWMIPGTVSGGVLSSQVSSLGYSAAGTVVLQAQAKAQAASLTERLTAAAARVLPQADSASEGGGLVVQPVDCETHITELKLRLARAATEADPNRALGIQQDLRATREACSAVRAAELQQASCDALALAQANAPIQIASDLTEFRRLTVPLLSAQAFVETTGATCSNANTADNPALIEAKFDQLLDIMKGQMARAEFDDTLTVRDLGVVLHLDVMCQQMGLEAICTRLSSELYPDLLDALRTSAFNDCRNNGTPLSVSQFYALGSQAGDADKFYGHGRFSLAAVEADLNYCSNPSLGLRVFDGEAVPGELTDRATTISPLVSVGNYVKQKTIEVPRDGSLNMAGTVGVLRCPDGSASGADLVVRINGQEWVRRAASGDAYPLESAPLLLDLPTVLPGFGIDPATSTGFTVRVNREGGACSDGKQAVLDAPFTLFEVQVNLPEAVPTGERIVSASEVHTCALTSAGGVKCWGDNLFGSLGDGSTTDSLVPVNVSGLGSGVTAISAGQFHTCALTSAGGVKCWGYNAGGELGDGSTTNRLVPVNVASLGSDVTAISAGQTHTCALTSAGGVRCWGRNGFGQLGDGSTNHSLVPVNVTGLGSGVTAISSGNGYSCALTSAGGVKCWGAATLGDGITDSLVPVNVPGLEGGVAAISAGHDHACALTAAGGVKCWGSNAFGWLGDGSATGNNVWMPPVDVSGLGSGVRAISVGAAYACALTGADGVKCWGANVFGQLGNGSLGDSEDGSLVSEVPVSASVLGGDVISIRAGKDRTCALTLAGVFKCWGSNGHNGLLGGGNTNSYSTTPVNVIGFP